MSFPIFQAANQASVEILRGAASDIAGIAEGNGVILMTRQNTGAEGALDDEQPCTSLVSKASAAPNLHAFAEELEEDDELFMTRTNTGAEGAIDDSEPLSALASKASVAPTLGTFMEGAEAEEEGEEETPMSRQPTGAEGAIDDSQPLSALARSKASAVPVLNTFMEDVEEEDEEEAEMIMSRQPTGAEGALDDRQPLSSLLCKASVAPNLETFLEGNEEDEEEVRTLKSNGAAGAFQGKRPPLVRKNTGADGVLDDRRPLSSLIGTGLSHTLGTLQEEDEDMFRQNSTESADMTDITDDGRSFGSAEYPWRDAIARMASLAPRLEASSAGAQPEKQDSEDWRELVDLAEKHEALIKEHAMLQLKHDQLVGAYELIKIELEQLRQRTSSIADPSASNGRSSGTRQHSEVEYDLLKRELDGLRKAYDAKLATQGREYAKALRNFREDSSQDRLSKVRNFREDSSQDGLSKSAATVVTADGSKVRKLREDSTQDRLSKSSATVVTSDGQEQEMLKQIVGAYRQQSDAQLLRPQANLGRLQSDSSVLPQRSQRLNQGSLQAASNSARPLTRSLVPSSSTSPGRQREAFGSLTATRHDLSQVGRTGQLSPRHVFRSTSPGVRRIDEAGVTRQVSPMHVVRSASPGTARIISSSNPVGSPAASAPLLTNSTAGRAGYTMLGQSSTSRSSPPQEQSRVVPPRSDVTPALGGLKTN